ncbi:MAG: hypothetical protein ACLU4P_04580 [Ruminococcus sp.]
MELFSSKHNLGTCWCAPLVFFMQAGFAMVETGFTRAKNAGNIIMKNLMDFCYRHPAVLACGLWHHVWCGANGFFRKDWSIASEAQLRSGNASCTGFRSGHFLIFQTVFLCSSSNHCFRCHGRAHQIPILLYLQPRSSALIVISVIRSLDLGRRLVISQMGFHDFAGSCCRHIWWAAWPPLSAP